MVVSPAEPSVALPTVRSASPPHKSTPDEVRAGDHESSCSIHTELFASVASCDVLNFEFNGRAYAEDLRTTVAKTGKLCGVSVWDTNTLIMGEHRIVYVEHDFGFFGGSLGCAEGEKICRAFEYAGANSLPIVVLCVSGGARMQEGTLSLMQMAKVSCAVAAYKQRPNPQPYLTLIADPCFGGVSASYAMQSDLKIGVSKARFGFSGPAIILNTQFGMDQAKYDENCPAKFQSTESAFELGQLDVLVKSKEAAFTKIGELLGVLAGGGSGGGPPSLPPRNDESQIHRSEEEATTPSTVADTDTPSGKAGPRYLRARGLDRFDADDVVQHMFEGTFLELGGDGKQGLDACLRGGIALFGKNQPCVVLKCGKGHSPDERKKHNWSMPSPAGYRTCLRLFDFAERFGLPIVSFVDVVGAWCSFEAELAGQSEALATNLLRMAGLKIPVVTVLLSEGGSGGALAAGAMGDRIGMLENAYYGVITPEGAASILGRYKNETEKKERFQSDCAKLANTQQIYPEQLLNKNVIDEIIGEGGASEDML